MLNIKIFGGRGRKKAADVDDEGHLYTISAPYPAFEAQKTRPFKQYFTLTGAAGGSNDMGIDGSVTSQEFYVLADQSEDIYITSVNVIVGYGTTAQPNQFADAAALTNGLRFYYTSTAGEQEIDDAIKSNTELLRLGNDSIVPTAWEVRHVGAANDYGYFISINLRQFSPGLGVKLDKGSSQRIAVTVRDDATNADTLNMQAYGFKRFE